MSWMCPNCGKKYRNANQWHSCTKLSVEHHLKNNSEEITELYQELMIRISEFGQIEINPIKTSIQVRARAAFLSIQIKKKHLEIEFQLGYEYNELPVYKVIRISKNRVLHFAAIYDENDLNNNLIDVLRESYKLIRNTGK